MLWILPLFYCCYVLFWVVMDNFTNICYDILNSKVIRGHQRSLEVKRRSNFKNTFRDSIFCMHTHIISLNNIGYDILTSKINRCHQRSVEVKWGQIWKIHPGSPFLTCEVMFAERSEIMFAQRNEVISTERSEDLGVFFKFDLIWPPLTSGDI